MKKSVWTIICIVIILLIIIVVRLNSSSASTIKIGAALALTGDAAPWGEESLKSAQMAVDEINEKGGVKGKKLELDVEDMKSSSKDSVTAISKLVNVNKVQAVMITWLDSYPGAESVIPKDMVLISQDAAIETVNTPVDHPNVFSFWYRTSAKAQVTMEAMKKAGVKTLYLVLQHDPYYTKLAEFLATEAGKQSIKIVSQDLINPDNDARTVIAKIGEMKPDAVFFGSYDPKLSFGFIKKYREILGSKIALYGDEFIEQDLSDANFSPAWLEGIPYYVPATPDKSFSQKFKARFGHDPMFSAGTTYDTVYVLAKYFEDSPSDLSHYMITTQFDTITYGKITFDNLGGVVSDNSAIMMKKVYKGKPVEFR
jgi:branched-chain amino acid transport system substrate-binding protein